MEEHVTEAGPEVDGVEAQAVSRGQLALGLAIASLVLSLLFIVACPGLSCLSLGIAGVSVLMAYSGMAHARDSSLHIAALALGMLSAGISLLMVVIFGVIMAFYGGVLSIMLLNGP